MKAILISLVFILFSFSTLAAISKTARSLPAPSSIIRGVGAISGGQTGSNMSLMDFRRTSSKKAKIERLVMDFGGPNMKARKGMAGYYHVEVSYNPKRVVIDLPQILASQLTEAEILKRLKGSSFIESGMLNFDRTAQTMQIVLQLKNAVNVKVLQVQNPKVVGKLVLDLSPYKR